MIFTGRSLKRAKARRSKAALAPFPQMAMVRGFITARK
jgi:hypothetical protein